MKIILASSSKYRQALLAKTGFQFESIKPDVDEELLKNQMLAQAKSPLEIAEALSKYKGQSIAQKNPDDVVISGDQLVDFKNEIIGKPYTQEKAIQQLTRMNNGRHQLITATTIYFKSQIFHDNNITHFKMQNLTADEITNYVELDNPIDCAGSCKIESRGICLFEKIECSDFTAIEGLPLIWITHTLKGLGHELFKN
jgi:septum formation protein